MPSQPLNAIRNRNIFEDLWGNITSRHILLVVSLYIFLILIIKNRYDYAEYGRQWQFFLAGGNPWDYISNAYGPLHNSMAFVYDIHHKLPRLLFSSLSVIGSIFLIKKVNGSALNENVKEKSFYLLLYNPIVWLMFVINGCNDGLVGSLFLFGVVLYDKEKYVLSALLLSLAILYKYIPLFIIPILCINSRKINFKFTLSTIAFLGIGFGTSFYLWGAKFLDPILFNASRESKILSIFRYLRGDYSFLKLFGIDNVDHLSIYFVIGSVILIFIVQLVYRWHWIVSLIVTMLSIHLFYLVGHFQFYISIYFLLFFYLYKFGRSIGAYELKRIFLSLYWIAATTVLYGITEGLYGRFVFIREFIGLPHFIILLLTLISIVSMERNKLNKVDALV